MKVNFDTANWFKDKTFTAIVIIGILTVLNTILLCVLLSNNCQKHEIQNGFNNPGIHTMMIRK